MYPKVHIRVRIGAVLGEVEERQRRRLPGGHLLSTETLLHLVSSMTATATATAGRVGDVIR